MEGRKLGDGAEEAAAAAAAMEEESEISASRLSLSLVRRLPTRQIAPC